MKEVNDLRLQIDSKKTFLVLIVKTKASILILPNIKPKMCFFGLLMILNLLIWQLQTNLQDYGFVRISITHLFSNWQSKKQFRIGICQASCFKMIQTMKKISFLGLCLHTKRAHCWHHSIFTALLSSILIFRRRQLWHASLHHGITFCQICRIDYFSLCYWYNIEMCPHFPPSSPMNLLEKNFA